MIVFQVIKVIFKFLYWPGTTHFKQKNNFPKKDLADLEALGEE